MLDLLSSLTGKISSFMDCTLTVFEWFAAILYLVVGLSPFIILFYCLV